MPGLARTESIKLIASWFNSVSAALMTVGVFTPLAVTVYGIGDPLGTPTCWMDYQLFALAGLGSYIRPGSGSSENWMAPMMHNEIMILAWPAIGVAAMCLFGWFMSGWIDRTYPRKPAADGKVSPSAVPLPQDHRSQ